MIRPFLGDHKVKIDRKRQIITFKRNGEVVMLTVDQLFDVIADMFEKDPEQPLEAIQTGEHIRNWLTECDKPLTDPLKYHNQALTRPARPLAAP